MAATSYLLCTHTRQGCKVTFKAVTTTTVLSHSNPHNDFHRAPDGYLKYNHYFRSIVWPSICICECPKKSDGSCVIRPTKYQTIIWNGPSRPTGCGAARRAGRGQRRRRPAGSATQNGPICNRYQISNKMKHNCFASSHIYIYIWQHHMRICIITTRICKC